MTVTTAPTWRPFHDEPLFTDDLLRGVDDIPDTVRRAIVGYLEQVAQVRRVPLHTATAFNALHFGFDLENRGYQAAVLDPELFVRLTTGAAAFPVLPVGTFVRIERGQQSLWAEVIARFGADDGVDVDGWVPARLSGAAAALDDDGCRLERVVLDPEAFGVPLTAGERGELNRLRRRGVLLDDRGHLTGRVCYPDPRLADLDDIALYAHLLLTTGKPLLVGGPLGGLLTDPTDDETLAVALQVALATIDDLLARAPGLLRWGAYATPVNQYERRRASRGILDGTDLDEAVRAATRATSGPRFTGVWPLLAGWVDAAKDSDPDPLHLAGAAEAVVHANLTLADTARSAVNGLLPSGVHLRIDDRWQAGGVWLAQPTPVPTDVRDVDPLRPLGLGYHQSLPATTPVPGDTDEPTSEETGHPQPSSEPPLPVDAGSDTSGESETGTHPTDSDTDDSDQPGDGIRSEPADPNGDTALDPSAASDEDVDGDAMTVEHVDDSLTVYTVALRPTHLDTDTLPLPDHVGVLLAAGPAVVELHHDGDELADDERIHHTERTGSALTGVAWPMSFYPGIKVTVAVARGASRLSATTSLLRDPLPYGPDFRWAADIRVLAAALSLEADDEAPPDIPTPPAPAPTVEARYRGIDPLRGLIITALRRYGDEGSFGARRLTGPRLFTALFGPDLCNPPLMWQVIYTCERLVDAGKLTCEPNPGRPDRPGSGGPDAFVWWPSDSAREQAHIQAAQQRQAILRDKVREHWIPPRIRALPRGYRASDEAEAAYADYVREVRGPNADTRLPGRYTFVKGHRRGSDPGPVWLRLT